jgi:hypothetical protein
LSYALGAAQPDDLNFLVKCSGDLLPRLSLRNPRGVDCLRSRQFRYRRVLASMAGI